ncbi:hyalin-like [Acanthaster planci]|uniref:Hyalin-like n=1 Tax=Acanthaster planci TaxID=133434 RepID=A0A8B7ZQQ4_ACAPL|nr:hyalin-like [Acanthaster planci]
MWNPSLCRFGQQITNVAQSHQLGQVFNIGRTVVTYLFTASSGSQGVCQFTVTVNAGLPIDNTPPTFVVGCPSEVTVSAPSGSTTFVVNWDPPVATDNSGTVDTFASHNPGSTFFVGVPTTVTYRFTDPSGNSLTCSFTVLVNVGTVDNTPPTITGCPSGVSVMTAPGATTATASWQPPVGQDNSGVAPQVFNSHSPGDTFGVGNTQVFYRFVDGSGNEATCLFLVTVSTSGGVDTINPVLTGCPTGVTAYVSAAVTSVRVTWTEPTATDNSGVVPMLASNPSVNSIFPLGLTTVTYTATDGAGNRATCAFVVNVIVDLTAPVISGCPISAVRGTLSAGQATTSLTWTEPTATDNSQLPVTRNRTHVPGQAFPIGTTNVIYTFSDSVNNEAICTFMVIVSSSTPSNPCSSNPCPSGQLCFYTADAYLCRPGAGRKRRDALPDDNRYCPCENGGECVHVESEPPASYCICPMGFRGVLCEKAVINECNPNPCANNGTCTVTIGSDPSASYHYSCLCSEGWTGPNCLNAVNDELVIHTGDLTDLTDHRRGLMETEWLLGSLIAVIIILFLVFAVTVIRITRRTVLPTSKADDEVAIIH